ncbi:hypothetical protein SAMN05414139_05386 [Burkholderia sp. D7]|nr:hypothetical protein SAMN05414139_05386 [Burkholderia sp. D7]
MKSISAATHRPDAEDFIYLSSHSARNTTYHAGDLAGREGNIVADLGADFDPPCAETSYKGSVDIGRSRLEIRIPELRGIGLGSFFMSFIIDTVHQVDNVPVDTILLSADDARTHQDRDRRNHFYEKLGFSFDYEDDWTWRQSRYLESRDLIPPAKTWRQAGI